MRMEAINLPIQTNTLVCPDLGLHLDLPLPNTMLCAIWAGVFHIKQSYSEPTQTALLVVELILFIPWKAHSIAMKLSFSDVI